MGEPTSLQGSCSCGRNSYLVVIPINANREHAQVIFDDSSDNRKAQAAPLTAWLRVPLSWYQSSTTAYFPDETHGEIRRTFIPHHAPHARRTFCAHCGTHLSYWSEEPPSEAEFLSVTVGSLSKAGLEALEDLELLPEDVPADSLIEPTQALTFRSANDGETTRRAREGTSGGIQWFEDLISGSRLGRTERSRRGLGSSRDGTTTVEWEVTEVVDDDGGTTLISSKRKYGGSA